MTSGNTLKKPNLLVSCAALFNEDGGLLLAQRPKSRALAGLWELPGGKIEPFETPEAALIRELDEEIGIKAREKDLLPLSFVSHDCGKFHLLMPVYELRAWDGTPVGREGQALQWVDERTLYKLGMPEPDLPLRPLLARLMSSEARRWRRAPGLA